MGLALESDTSLSHTNGLLYEVLRSLGFIRSHLDETFVERMSHEALQDWACVSRGILIYTLALTRWLLESLYTPSSLLVLSHSLLREVCTGKQILTFVHDTLFVLHSRQYSFISHALDIFNSCTILKSQYAKPIEVRAPFNIQLKIIDVNRCARVALTKGLHAIPMGATASIDSATVSLSAGEFALVATLTGIKLANQMFWEVETDHQMIDTSRLCGDGGATLHKILYLIVQVVRIRAMNVFDAAACELFSTRSDTFGFARFKNIVFLRAWPNQSMERTWSVVVSVNISLGHGMALDATATSLPFRVLSSSLFFPCGNRFLCCSAITPFGLLDIVTTLAASRAVSCVLAENYFNYLGRDCHFVTHFDDLIITVTCPFGVSMSVTCLPFYGTFHVCDDSRDETFPRTLHTYDHAVRILAHVSFHNKAFVHAKLRCSLSLISDLKVVVAKYLLELSSIHIYFKEAVVCTDTKLQDVSLGVFHKAWITISNTPHLVALAIRLDMPKTLLHLALVHAALNSQACQIP